MARCVLMVESPVPAFSDARAECLPCAPSSPLRRWLRDFWHHARMVELVDTLVLEASAQAWGFKSPSGHHLRPRFPPFPFCRHCVWLGLATVRGAR